MNKYSKPAFTIYPAYYDNKRTLSDGRKTKLECCVEKPTVLDIIAACKLAQIPCEKENHSYSRDFLNPDRVAINKNLFKSKKELVNVIGEKLQCIDRKVKK